MQGAGGTADFPLHLLLRGFRQIDASTQALEAQEFERLVGGVDLFLRRIDFQPVLRQETEECGLMAFQRFAVRREEDDVVGITGIHHAGVREIPVHFHQIDVGQEGCGRRAGHDAAFFPDNLSVGKRPVVREHPLEETIQVGIVGQQPLQDGKQDRDGYRIEIIVDIELVSPHPPAAECLADRVDGVARPQAAAEGIAVGRKCRVITIQEMGHQLERPGLFQVEAIDGPFLPRPHLVDALALGDTGALPFHHGAGNRQIQFLRHIRIGILEQRPGKTALHQAMSQEFIPRRLTFQLSENAVHAKKKGKRGKDLNQQNC